MHALTTETTEQTTKEMLHSSTKWLQVERKIIIIVCWKTKMQQIHDKLNFTEIKH